MYVGVPEAKGEKSEAAQQGLALAHALGLQGLAPMAWAETLVAAGWDLEIFDGAEALSAPEASGKGGTLAPAKVIAPRSFSPGGAGELLKPLAPGFAGRRGARGLWG